MERIFDLKRRDGGRYGLHVAPFRSVGPREASFLFGGIGLGAAVAAAERELGRAAIWATAQYLSYAPRGSDIAIDVSTLVAGHHMSQVRVDLHGDAGPVVLANLALGARPNAPRRQWLRPRTVPPPEDCAAMPLRWGRAPDDLYCRLDARIARGWDVHSDVDAANIAFWLRPTAGDEIDRAMLALMGDFLPASIAIALSDGLGNIAVNSLDNCIRYLFLVETDFVLADISLQGMSSGFAHGQMSLFARDGTLMATASQSVIIRSSRPRMAL